MHVEGDITTSEMVVRLRETRDVFDAKVADVPTGAFDVVPEGHAHSPKDVVAHVSAYEALIVERLREAREGRSTEFDRDREGWEAFNHMIWAEAADMDEVDVRAQAVFTFSDLLAEIAGLTDAELNTNAGVTGHVDPAWLEDRTLAQAIAIDSFEHYPMHHDTLNAAIKQAS
jgi:hypothetical protein